MALQLNQRSKTHPIGKLQRLRRELKGLARVPSEIFLALTIHKKYAFHYGGRKELQFNIGIDPSPGYLRFGVAFSLEPNKSLPDIDVLRPKIARFNEFLRTNPDDFSGLRMWHYRGAKGKRSRSDEHPPAPIPESLIQREVFVFLGWTMPKKEFDPEVVLDGFDRLLPLYRFVESDEPHPGVTRTRGFDFSPGCSAKPSFSSTVLAERRIDIRLRQNDLQSALYECLVARLGRESVASEQATGTDSRVDIAIREAGKYWFYEIKTASTARMCIREALGQLLDYSYWPGSQQAERLIVVGEPVFDAEAAGYLVNLRDRFELPIYYQQFDFEKGLLVDEPG